VGFGDEAGCPAVVAEPVAEGGQPAAADLPHDVDARIGDAVLPALSDRHAGVDHLGIDEDDAAGADALDAVPEADLLGSLLHDTDGEGLVAVAAEGPAGQVCAHELQAVQAVQPPQVDRGSHAGS